MKPYAVYLETYGCQMNKLDSGTVHAVLESGGFRVVDDMRMADVILLNTCAVRDNAEQRIHGRIGELQVLTRERPDLVFGIIGCMAQRIGEELLSRRVRVVAGPDAYRRLPGLIRRALEAPAADVQLDNAELYDDVRPFRESPYSAWVAVTRGCDNFCSYCIVPYTRGRERSLPADQVVGEVARLCDEGYREVTLLGQNVNSYRDGDIGFAELLGQVADTGIGWVRFMTSHPRDLTEDILEVMAERANICSHLHLPLQSGSDRVLDLMNRRYTMARYRDIVRRARELVPGIAVTTDLIFGFPGEGEDDWRQTLALMEEIRFDFAFLYRYSERSGTRACDFPDAVPEEERIARLSAAIDLQNGITTERNRSRVGTVIPVLIKDVSKDGRGWYGFSEVSVPVVVIAPDGTVAPGDIVDVRIESTTGASLVGVAVTGGSGSAPSASDCVCGCGR